VRITLSLLLAASAPRAQDLTLRSTTRFIAVDVTPSRHGAPVRGLKAEDFVITGNGEAQTVRLFFRVDAEAIRATGESRCRSTRTLFLCTSTPG
jgi:hypothetical protein